MMNDLRARLTVTLQTGSLVCAAWLLSATCAAAAPITIGTFQLQNDVDDPLFTGPTFVVTNDSIDTVSAGFAATFSSLHLVFDLLDHSSLDFLLTGALDAGDTIKSDGIADLLGNSLLPDLVTVADAYLTLTLLDRVTGLALDGVFTLGPTDPPLCASCTDRMSDLTNGSTLAIQFDPASPTGPAPVPEPASLILMGSGIAAWAVRRRRASR